MCARTAHAPLIIRVPKGETSRITLKVARNVNYLTVRVAPDKTPVEGAFQACWPDPVDMHQDFLETFTGAPMLAHSMPVHISQRQRDFGIPSACWSHSICTCLLLLRPYVRLGAETVGRGISDLRVGCDSHTFEGASPTCKRLPSSYQRHC